MVTRFEEGMRAIEAFLIERGRIPAPCDRCGHYLKRGRCPRCKL